MVLYAAIHYQFPTQKTKLAGMLQVPQENRSVLDAQNKATGLRLSLGVTCHLHNLEAELQSLAVNSSEMMLLNLTTHHLVEDSCEWVCHDCVHQIGMVRYGMNSVTYKAVLLCVTSLHNTVSAASMACARL